MEKLNNTDKTSENAEKELRISDVSNSGLDEPFGYATTVELMLMLGKAIDDALDIHNHLEKIANGDDV